MNVQSTLPIASHAQDSSTKGTTGSSKGSNSTTPNNQLDANSFITLLTAQLQAQDPLNPMDPQDMMNELVSLNTLQELIRIRQDIEGTASSGTGTTGSSKSDSVKAPSPSNHDVVVQSRVFPAQSPASN